MEGWTLPRQGMTPVTQEKVLTVSTLRARIFFRDGTTDASWWSDASPCVFDSTATLNDAVRMRSSHDLLLIRSDALWRVGKSDAETECAVCAAHR